MSVNGSAHAPTNEKVNGRPSVPKRLTSRRILPQRITKPRLISRLSIPSFPGSGRAHLLSPLDPQEAESQLLGILAIRIYAARDLESKDKNGKSDPFFYLRAGDLRVRSDVVKASLNPVWGDLPDGVRFHAKDGFSRKPVHVEFPVHASHVERQRVEVIFWDKDRLTKNDYLGEVSLGLEDWFSKTLQSHTDAEDIPVSFADERNKPRWYPLVSSRARHTAQGEVLIRVGFVPTPSPANPPSSTRHDAKLPEERERDLAEFFIDLYHHKSPATATEQVLMAPPTQGVGTLLLGDNEGRRMSLGIGMGDPEASENSDDELDDYGSETEDDESMTDMDDDEEEEEERGRTMTPFENDSPENITPAGIDGSNTDSLALAGARLVIGQTAPFEPGESSNSLAVPVSTDSVQAPTTAATGGSRGRLHLPGFIKRTGSSLSMSSIRSTGSGSKGSGLLNLREKMKQRPSSLDVGDVLSNDASRQRTRRRKLRRRRPRPMTRVGSTMSSRHGGYELQSDNDIIGICFIEIASAHDLPRWKNMTRTTFDMDPFVIASFAQKIFRTRVIRHSLDPVWGERLFFHVKRHEAPFSISFSCFDWDRVSANDFIGEVSLDMSALIQRAPKANGETHLYPHKHGRIIGDELHEFRLALVPARTEELDAKKPCEITVRAKFTPYAALRQQFWRLYLQQYDSDDSGEFSDVEIFSMLDSLGSTLTMETRQSFFSRFGKTDADTLTADELINCVESEMHKPSGAKKLVDTAAVRSGPSTVELQLPLAENFARASMQTDLSDNAGLAGFGFTGADRLEPDNSSKEPVITNVNGSSDAQTPSRSGSGDADTLEDMLVERVINIKACPLCHRPRLSKRSEMDIVTHLALCASQDWNTVGSLLTGNFVTVSQAHRKWLTKVISKVSSGSYELGANSANIIVQNRLTGQLQEEKMQVYVRLGIRLLYKGFGSNRMEGARIRRLLESMSVKQGNKFDSPESAKDILPFIAFHKMDMSEVRDPVSSFSVLFCFYSKKSAIQERTETFNQFFYRKLNPEARPAAEGDNPNVLVSSADCRMMAFATVTEATRIWVKGREFSIARLLGDKFADEAKRYEGGAMCIFRLAPQDYHRFHSPVDGVVGETSSITGQYYTVNPMAIRSAIDVYGDNVRQIVPLDSPQFGRVFNACIGAMMVGSIRLTVKPGEHVKRAQEYGYFAFGGSTIVCLFLPDMVQFDGDILENSSRAIETLVRVGMRIGIKSA